MDTKYDCSSSLDWLKSLSGKISIAIFLVLISALPVIAQQDARTVRDHSRPRPTTFSKPVLIEFHGEIDGLLTGFFNRAMDSAEAAGADLILQMARRLRDCKAYTVVIIENEAISGGSLVSLGCDEIQINPDAKFGDSGEIGFDTEQWAWRLIEPKIESYLSRDARDLAESKGRNPDLAEAMVDSDHLVYSRISDDKTLELRGITEDEVLDPSWDLIIETKKDRFLTVSGQRAVELGIAQGHASSRPAIASFCLG